jgi:hypothetical protein
MNRMAVLSLGFALLTSGNADGGTIVSLNFTSECGTAATQVRQSSLPDSDLRLESSCSFDWGDFGLTGDFDASAWAYSRVVGNSLSVFATTTASGSGGFPSGPVVAGAVSSVGRTGTIQFDSAGLFRLGFLASGSATSTDCQGFSLATLSASFQVGGFYAPLGASWSSCGPISRPALHYTEVVGFAGQIIDFSYSFSAAASAQGWAAEVMPIHSATATANGGQTLYAFVLPVTPGASFHSLDGIDYSLPVTAASEPAFLLLIGAGLVGAGVRRWRGIRS